MTPTEAQHREVALRVLVDVATHGQAGACRVGAAKALLEDAARRQGRLDKLSENDAVAQLAEILGSDDTALAWLEERTRECRLRLEQRAARAREAREKLLAEARVP